MDKTIFLTIILSLVLIGNFSDATTLNYDFNSGISSDFQVSNDSDLFDVDASSGNLRISKSSDDGTINPSGFINAGIRSIYSIAGDFTITVDFTLNDFPETVRPQLNESILGVSSTNNDDFFWVLRFSSGTRDRIEAYSEGPMGLTTTNILTGSYQISRIGSTVTGLYSSDGLNFNVLGSVSDFSDPINISLLAAQGQGRLGERRSTTSLDISFDDLVIEADQIINPVPEPGTMILFCFGLIGIAGVGRKQQRWNQVNLQ